MTQRWVRRDPEDGEVFESITRDAMRCLIRAKAAGGAPQIEHITLGDGEIRVELATLHHPSGKVLVYQWEE